MAAAAPIPAYGWPDVLSASLAGRYASRSRWVINRAVKDGTLRPLGKRGKSWTFAKSEVDRWLGNLPEPKTEAAAAAHSAPDTRDRETKRGRPRRLEASVEIMLFRSWALELGAEWDDVIARLDISRTHQWRLENDRPNIGSKTIDRLMSVLVEIERDGATAEPRNVDGLRVARWLLDREIARAS